MPRSTAGSDTSGTGTDPAGADGARSDAGERLAPYRGKRDFSRTPEPSGAVGAPPAAGRRFVVQRHRARRLHYDFRLEIDGALASWAVPKGPTLDPGVRRAAFHVEDHPMEYIDFEGAIPAGEYGGGDVIVWDQGSWEPDEAGDPPDPARALRDGELHLDLWGQKLVGRFILIRTRTEANGREQWLLLHKHDEYAVEGWDPEDHPRSVVSGRTNDEVRADPERMWRSDLPPERAAITLKPGALEPGGLERGALERGALEGGALEPGALEPEAESGPAPVQGALAQLDRLDGEGIWEIYGRELHVTNLDKVLFPARSGEDPVTKRDFLRYAASVAPVILPYLDGRALNMHRFPNGAGTKGFWHKALPEHAPQWLTRWEDAEADSDGTRTYLVVDEPAALVWVANFGALEWHAWTSRVDHPRRPTYALVDLDPGSSTSWEQLLVIARLHRTALEHLGVSGRAKVTGQHGIQIWIPVAPGYDFAQTRAWTEQLSKAVGAVVPDLVSWKWQVDDRSGLARLDYTQNARHKTLVAPYSPRPAPGAPVSAPIEWDELDDPGLRPDGFTIRTVLPRLAEKGDLFRPVLAEGQHLPPLA